MSAYELVLTMHILAAIVWIGSGFFLQVLAQRAQSTANDERLRGLLDDTAALGNKVFVPASALTLVFGLILVLVLDSPWSFGQLWILIGMAGAAATFVTGIVVIEPGVRRAGELIARDGGMSPEARAAARRVLTLARVDYVVLLIVVADMVIKPTGDDVAVLVVMALLLVAGFAYVLSRARAIGEPADPVRA
jgi:uncharacterized membrane protein